jgi:hypothetical protein
MPRGPARDTVPTDTAEMVRRAVIKARDKKGLTNHELADHLDWDYRTATNALQDGRPLRLPNATSILRAATELPPRRDGQNLGGKEAWAIRKEVQTILAPPRAALTNLRRKRWPAALVASYDLKLFAELVADAIVSRPGFSERKRAVIENAIIQALKVNAGRLTFAAHQQITRGIMTKKPNRIIRRFSEEAAAQILALFGYEVSGSD